MPQLHELMHPVKRPLFAVLRNFELLDNQTETPIECSQMNGEFVGLARTFDQAHSLVPKACYPDEADDRERFHQRFGWRDIALSDGSLVREVPAFGLDDQPLGAGRSEDKELFGETYTIVWLCPPDVEIILNTLIEQTLELVGNQNRPSSLQNFLEQRHALGPYLDPCKRIDRFVLLYVEEHFFRRICLWPDQTRHSDLILIPREVKARFLDQIKRWPCGPRPTDLKCLASQ